MIGPLGFAQGFQEPEPFSAFPWAEEPFVAGFGQGLEAGHEVPPAFSSDFGAGGLEGLQAGIDLAIQDRQVRHPSAVDVYLQAQRAGTG